MLWSSVVALPASPIHRPPTLSTPYGKVVVVGGPADVVVVVDGPVVVVDGPADVVVVVDGPVVEVVGPVVVLLETGGAVVVVVFSCDEPGCSEGASTVVLVVVDLGSKSGSGRVVAGDVTPVSGGGLTGTVKPCTMPPFTTRVLADASTTNDAAIATAARSVLIAVPASGSPVATYRP
jgi:hypothetical protein